MSAFDEPRYERLRDVVQALQESGGEAEGLIGADLILDMLRVLRAHRDAIASAVSMTVVQALADLPASAGPREFFRVVATPGFLYVGNGPNRPLSRIALEALPAV